jgi:hypothetical protein
MRFLRRNSPHRPTASEPGKSATQAEVDGDYFCYRFLPLPARGVDRAPCPLLVLHPHTAGRRSHSHPAERSRERTR